ncbi:hypothetical protein [uncultured Tateyamaria sp.]|uniref:tetratricopeptide repeat protein n=1 Tax=uncultured Tateyamaria sp. TaxID=455651 RepID=UPI002636342C|nr:hypothetical protein [uncultured Tateyamaria sp.]
MPSVLGSLILVLMLSSAVQSDISRSEFDAIQSQETHDPEAAFDAMLVLAHSGHIPAANRVGYYYRHGLGTHKDLTAARRWYQHATASGHRWAFASLARVELALGHADAALHLLQQAARDQHPGTARLLGTAHIDRAFGAASDPALGQHMLRVLARDGDANAARDLLLRYNWNRIRGQAPDHIVKRVVQIGLEGDARFAEAALVYLTRERDKRSQITRQREALISVPGIQRRTLLMERVRLAADLNPGRFWIETEKVLQDTETEHYARVAGTAFWINKNAWVRVLQKELRGLGYYSGRITAEMTARTIRAQNQFCKDRGIWELCASGPLRGQTVRAVADAIAMARDRG